MPQQKITNFRSFLPQQHRGQFDDIILQATRDDGHLSVDSGGVEQLWYSKDRPQTRFVDVFPLYFFFYFAITFDCRHLFLFSACQVIKECFRIWTPCIDYATGPLPSREGTEVLDLFSKVILRSRSSPSYREAQRTERVSNRVTPSSG